jgi:RNA polymerase sigma-70 factor (ECF subfamily)
MTPGSGAAARAALRAGLRDESADLLAYFERRVEPRADAADLLCDVMLTAWRRVDQLPEAPERRRMWLFTIAAHVLANHRRSMRRRGALTDRLRGLLAASGAQPDPGEAHAVRDAVRRLPAPQRDLVTLVHWDGFTLAEAAEILGVNPSTARSRYAVAKAALHSALAVEAG